MTPHSLDGAVLDDAPVAGPAAVPFARGLAGYGDRPAIVTTNERLSYRELASRVADVARRLGTTRRLVLIAGSNQIDSVVCYLGALSAGHVALLAPPGQAGAVAASYEPDVVAGRADDGTWWLDERRLGSAHDLHPDLALLMSTSGSTGSPKLVRLSHQNVQANAESIAEYLGIQDTDRAGTTLPMHYCYGLSVINSHLARGASLLLTDLSVVDSCFWDLFHEHSATTFAGVPHTFDLLDRIGFADMRLPRLRYVTQAGGRLTPERVVHYAELGRARGWDLFVMYGQTEATARMAYLPPDLAASHPHTIGVPVPGGSFSIEPLGDDSLDAGTDTSSTDISGAAGAASEAGEVGELVYTGPNVMLGYAETPADLALGPEIAALHTGDLARLTDAGLYEIVGRRARFVKILGLRVDLEHLETVLAGHDITACCAGSDGRLVVVAERADDAEEVRQHVIRATGQPAHAIHVCQVDELPRLPSGKPDYRAALRLAEITQPSAQATPEAQAARPGAATQPGAARSAEPVASPAELRDLFAELLNRPDATEDSTFVSLGGDSLSYVEMSVRLESALGHLPASWHVTPIRQLSSRPRRKLFSGRTVETSVLLRAAAIVVIVATHAGLFTMPGGAHVLLAVAGFNFARFRLTAADRMERVRQQLTSIARIAVPSMLWIGGAVLFTGQYGVANIVLLNGFLGAPTWTSGWHFWFVEILVYVLLAMAALTALPWADRLERRFPFGFVIALVACGLVTRFELVGLGVPHMMPAFWLFAIGWATARAGTRWQQILLTVVIVATVPGFFDNPPREALMIAGLALLVWTTSLPWPGVLGRLTSVLASASLFVYLTHWQVYPHLTGIHPVVAVVASLIAGVVVWMLVSWLTRHVVAASRQLSHRAAILKV